MVINVPFPGLEMVGDDVEQLDKIPANSITPVIFASLLGGVLLKSLLQFTSGNGAWLRQPGVVPQRLPTPTRAFSSDDVSQPGVFHALGPQGQDFDKYSELTAEGKRYCAPTISARTYGGE
jgi:hypothetical protein